MPSAFATRLAALASISFLIASPALAGTAADGIMTLKEFSVFAQYDAKLSQEVGGKTWIGGNLTGTGGQFGFGTNNAQGYTPPASGAAPTLTVGGNVNVNQINVQNGAAPGGPGGKVGPVGVQIGGTMSGGSLTFNAAGGVSQVGALTNVNTNLNGGTFAYGSKSGGNFNANGGAVATQNASINPALTNAIAAKTTQYAGGLTALSSTLFALAPDSTINASNNNDVKFIGAPGADGIAVFNITDAAAFFANASAFNFDGVSSATMVVINVTNATTIGQLNIHQNWVSDNATSADAFSQKVIWNFSSQILNIDVGQFDGSILAMNSNLSSSAGFIQGSVAVKSLLTAAGNGLNGEVHLGTFNGSGNLGAVPEPATWGLMIVGVFGMGAVLRRRQKLRAA